MIVYCSDCEHHHSWYRECLGEHEFCLANPYEYITHSHIEIRYGEPRLINSKNNCGLCIKKGEWYRKLLPWNTKNKKGE